VSRTSSSRRSATASRISPTPRAALLLGLGDEDRPVRPVPRRIRCPHQSWREMHRAGCTHPVEERVLPLDGTKRVRPSSTAASAGPASTRASHTIGR